MHVFSPNVMSSLSEAEKFTVQCNGGPSSTSADHQHEDLCSYADFNQMPREIVNGCDKQSEETYNVSIEQLRDNLQKLLHKNEQLKACVVTLAQRRDQYAEQLVDLYEQYTTTNRQYGQLKQEQQILSQNFQQLETKMNRQNRRLRNIHTLFDKQGLVMIGGKTGHVLHGERPKLISRRSFEQLLETGHNTLESCLLQMTSERGALEEEITQLRRDLERERRHSRKYQTADDGGQEDETRHLSRTCEEYEQKIHNEQQLVNNAKCQVERLTRQSDRLRTLAIEAEQSEDALTAERRKLLRQVRETNTRLEELETCNINLNKHMQRLQAAKISLISG